MWVSSVVKRLLNSTGTKSLVKACGLISCLLMLLQPWQGAEAVYINRFTTTTNGAITFVGNTLGLDGSATAGAPGNQGSIGAFTSTNTALTFGTYPAGTTGNWAQNGSTASLVVPPGSTILYAELIWGGSYSYGGEDVSASINTSITFKTPAGNYTVSPSAATAQTLGTPIAGGTCTVNTYCRYVRSTNVTGLVQIGQSGTYEVGGVPATLALEANNNGAGWTLAVVYSNPALPPRNLTVFVGAEAGGAAPTGVSGFCTNLSGPVKGRLLVSALEGDAQIAGDTMRFGPNVGSMVNLSGPNNPVGNFFGGQINGDTGALNLGGTFGGSNHNITANTSVVGARQGYDITNVDISSSLINSQTTAVAQGTTIQDQYIINALAIQIDVGAPKFPLTVKTANRTVTYVGDVVTYSINLDNTAGTANATNVFFTDTPPPGMSFVPGSVIVNGVAQPTFSPVTGFNVGTVATGAIGTVTFQVQVNTIPAAPAPAQYANKAKWTFDFISCAGFAPEAGLVETNANIITAIRIEPTKTVSPTGPVGVGQTLTYTITVPNTGAANSSGTSLTDLIPAGTSYVAGTTTLNGVSVPDVAGAMPYAAGALINSPTLAAGVIGAGANAVIRFQVLVNPSPPAIITNTAAVDPDGTGPALPINVAAVNTPLTPPVSAKSFSPSIITANLPSTLTIQVSNANAQALTVLAFSDTLPAGMVIANPPNLATTCPGATPLAVAGGITLGLSNGTVLASNSCTVSASVTSATPGVYTNIIPVGGISTANAGNNVAIATAQLTVLQGPTLNKSFSPSSIAPNGTSTLTISLVNPSTTAVTGANLTDNLPSGVVVAPVPAATSNCAGTFAPVAGATSVSLVGGVVAASNLCTMTVNVTSSTVGNYNNIIPTGALASSGGSNSTPATADLTVAAPVISKSFAPNVVGSNVNSVLTFSLSNPTNVAAAGVAFTDIFPTTPGAMTLTNTTFTNTCTGTVSNQTGGALATGSTGIRLVGGVIPAGGTCTLTFNVRASVGGNYLNTVPVGGLTTTNIGSSSAAATATLSVGLPAVRKAFGTIAAPITSFAAGTSVPLTIQVTNPNGAVMNLTTLTDVFPSGMQLFNTTTTNNCGGSISNATGGALAVGDTGIRLNGGSVAANSICTISVNVTSNVASTYLNTIPVGGLVTASGNNAFPATATVNVLSRPVITKSFSPVAISPTGTSTLTFTLTNSNAETLTTANFIDTFPTSPGAMTLASTANTNTCGGTLVKPDNTVLAAGSPGVRLNGGSIPGNGTCQITVTVTASVAGPYNNTVPAGALSTSNGGVSLVAANASLTVAVQAPVIAKAFAASPVGRNVATRLTFSINNPNVALAMTGVSFTDALPSIPGAMTVAPTPNVLVSGCGAGFTFNPTAGATSLTFSGGSIPSGSTCQVSVDVLASVAGTYNNTSGNVTSGNAGTGNVATASIRVLASPFVSKAFATSPISLGGVSAMTITISNPNAADSLSGVAVTDAYPIGLLNAASPNPQVSCSGGSSAAFTGGAAGGNAVGLTSGSLAPGGFCSVTLNVTATQAGNIDNTTGIVTSTNAGNGATAFARLVVGVDVSGFVYSDANTNSVKDGAEVGTGLGLFAKLVSGGTSVQVVAVNSVTGAYAFNAVVAGSYSIVIDNNNSASDVTPTLPPGWTGTEVPTQIRTLNVAGAHLINLNFGLNSATRISGRVFTDNGIGAGTPNDGVPNGGELGIAGATVRLTNCSGTVYATTTTDGSGNYSLQVPVSVASGATLCMTQTVPSGYLETGGSLGTATSASGVYTRATSSISFNYTIGTSLTGLSFGDVPVNTLSTDGAQTALPGSVVTYPHTFVAGSGGQVSFSTAALASPAIAGWSQVIYRDSNCNGQIDAGEPTLSTPVTVNAGDQVCVLVRDFVPGGAPVGAQDLVTLTANFTYTNATPALSAILTRTDTTTVGTPTSSGLRLLKSVNLATALPGSTLIYTITYRNDSTGPLSAMTINDTTPAFTTFVSATCPTPPANLTACTVSTAPTPGGVGALVWTFTGTLAPGAQGTVSFSVQVNN
jgi:uncharacterized repeat protein (TIGR01451 family)